MSTVNVDPAKTQGNSQMANKQSGNADPRNKEKAKKFKVLNKDGSLPDSPYNNQPGGGSLEGTVGVGR